MLTSGLTTRLPRFGVTTQGYVTEQGHKTTISGGYTGRKAPFLDDLRDLLAKALQPAEAKAAELCGWTALQVTANVVHDGVTIRHRTGLPPRSEASGQSYSVTVTPLSGPGGVFQPIADIFIARLKGGLAGLHNVTSVTESTEKL